MSNAASVALILAAVCILLSSSILTRVLLPKEVLICLFWLIFALSFALWTKDIGFGLLPRYALACYGLSFAVFFEYLFSGYSDFAQGMPMVDMLAHEGDIVAFVVTCGTLGLAGLIIGFQLTRVLLRPALSGGAAGAKPIGIGGAVLFCVLMPAVGSAALYLSQSRDTILTMSYSEISGGLSRPFVGGLAFDGMAYVVYVWLAAAWVATEQRGMSPELSSKIRRGVVLLVVLVTVTNLLRGGRSIAGLIAAMVVLYLTESSASESPMAERSTAVWRRMRRVLPWAVTAFLVFMVWGEVRAGFVEGGIDWEAASRRLSRFYKSGEWVAGIFACFGLAEEFFSGSLQYLHGQTYLDYLLSLPPSVVGRFFEYERPLEAFQGPSHWYIGYTVGGMNWVIVPFKNFGPIGIVVHTALCGFLIGIVENFSARREAIGRLMMAGVMVGGFHWFWYGDMYFVRVVMIVFLVAIPFRMFIGPLWSASAGGPGLPGRPRCMPALQSATGKTAATANQPIGANP